MFPNIDPKKMQAVMKQMGISQEEIVLCRVARSTTRGGRDLRGSGQEHNGEVQETPGELPRQSDPVHLGHIKVCDHGVKSFPFAFLKGLNAVLCGFALITLS